jgi:hypothetical protein
VTAVDGEQVDESDAFSRARRAIRQQMSIRVPETSTRPQPRSAVAGVQQAAHGHHQPECEQREDESRRHNDPDQARLKPAGPSAALDLLRHVRVSFRRCVMVLDMQLPPLASSFLHKQPNGVNDQVRVAQVDVVGLRIRDAMEAVRRASRLGAVPLDPLLTERLAGEDTQRHVTELGISDTFAQPLGLGGRGNGALQFVGGAASSEGVANVGDPADVVFGGQYRFECRLLRVKGHRPGLEQHSRQAEWRRRLNDPRGQSRCIQPCPDPRVVSDRLGCRVDKQQAADLIRVPLGKDAHEDPTRGMAHQNNRPMYVARLEHALKLFYTAVDRKRRAFVAGPMPARS